MTRTVKASGNARKRTEANSQGTVGADLEKTSRRLLNSSADKFYDPEVDIDWDAPLVAEKLYHPDCRISLYQTPLWERLTPEQRVELGKQEILSITSFGIYAEIALMHLLLRLAVKGDPTSSRARYALTEIGEECRHSVMFGRGIEKLGTGAYRQPKALIKALHALVFLMPIGPAAYAMTLLVEEMLDVLQRETMRDEDLQPHIRMINRIHVLEEARHITFAREGLLRSMDKIDSRLVLGFNRVLLAVAANVVPYLYIHPQVYRSVGIDPREGRRAARSNPHYRETLQWMSARMLRFFEDAGMVRGRLTKALWRRSLLMGKQT